MPLNKPLSEKMQTILYFIKKEKLFLIFLLFIHSAYFFYAVTYANIYTGDSDEYLQTAVNLKEHQESYNFIWTENKILEYYSLRPPLYGVFILIVKSVYNSDYFVIFIQNIISLFIWIYILFLSKDLKIPSKLPFIIIATLLLFPSQSILVNSIMSDIILQLWFVLSLSMLVYFFKTKKTSFLITYNVFLILAVYTKPALMYFWIPNMFFSFYLYTINKNIMVLASSLLLPLSIFIWCNRNENKTGYFHFSSIKTQNILSLNAGDVMKLTIGAPESTSVRKRILETANKLNYKEKNEFIIAASTRIIKDNILIYSYAHLKGMLNFMLATGRVDMVTFFPYKPEKEISIIKEIENNGLSGLKYYIDNVNLYLIIYMFFILLWNILLFLSTLSFYFTSEIHPAIKIFIIVIIGYICFVCGTAGYARFKMALLPFIVLTVPPFINSFKKRFYVEKPVSSI